MSDRYNVQMLVPQIGEDGQKSLSRSKVLVVGCGALGSIIIENLVRAGIGEVRFADSDSVELSNMSRQNMYSESDIGRPKAMAAEERMAGVNSEIVVKGIPEKVDASNIKELAEGVDLIMDAVDNFETRYLINEFSVSSGIPWIYTGVLGGQMMNFFILPDGPCFRCYMPKQPKPGSYQSTATAGVLNVTPGIGGNLAAAEAIKYLSGNRDLVREEMLIIDLFSNQFQKMKLKKLPDCPVCGKREFRLL